ncbi:MAG: response regulator transcription factor [Gemmatimonadaceae bacterium]
MNSTSRILVVEDNEDLAFGIVRTLESEGYRASVAPDGEVALEAMSASLPDLVILDLTLPGRLDGFRTLASLRSRGLNMPVLVLTARGEEADKVHGFRLGADDYVVKPFSLSELLARISALLRRRRLGNDDAPDETLRFGSVEINGAGRTATKNGERIALTPREFDLLLALARKPGVVLSRVALLRQVWGHEAEVMTRTVDIHIGELRKKIEEVPSEPRHIVTVWKTGYRFEP